MQAISTHNSAALPRPWSENGSGNIEAITIPNKGYHDDEHSMMRNPHLPSFEMATDDDFSSAHHQANHNYSIPTLSSSTTQQQPPNPPVNKRHCTESLWHTTRQAQHQNHNDPQAIMMMMRSIEQSSSHLQSSTTAAARKRASFHQNDSLQEYASSYPTNCNPHVDETIVKRRRGNLEAASTNGETNMLMQCESPTSTTATNIQEAEEVWNFIGIG